MPLPDALSQLVRFARRVRREDRCPEPLQGFRVPCERPCDDIESPELAQHLTTRLDEDGNPPALLTLADSLSAPFLLNGVVPGSPGVSGYVRQRRLGYRCGVRSDPDFMHLVFEHGDSSTDTLFGARLTADLDPSGGTTPVIVVSLLEAIPRGDMSSFSFAGASDTALSSFAATDAGQAGNLLCFYRQDVDSTAAADFRLFAERTGATAARVEIDRPSPDTLAVSGRIHTACVPAVRTCGCETLPGAMVFWTKTFGGSSSSCLQCRVRSDE
jgi:hypothetical protein